MDSGLGKPPGHKSSKITRMGMVHLSKNRVSWSLKN